MTRRRAGWPPSVAAAVLVGAYGWSAATGIPAGFAYARGAAAAAAGDFTPAAPALRRAAVGALRFDARWLAGEVALDRWEATGGRPEDLQASLAEFFEAWSVCPTSGWSRAGLAEAYARAESGASATRPLALGRLREGPFARLGDEGRLAIGFARRAIEAEPGVVAHRDGLVRVALRLGLAEEAAAAARGAGGVLPDLRHHDFGSGEPSVEILAAFVEGSRAALGRTPLLSRGGHLLALGLVDEKLGRLAQAEQDLRAAVREPGSDLHRAERSFHLGRILVARGEEREGEALLARSAERAEFGPAVASMRARLAESRGDLAGALQQLAALRRLRPQDLEPCLEDARVALLAGRVDLAREALGWALVLAPQDPRVHGKRVELGLANGDWRYAEAALRDFQAAGGEPDRTEDLRRRVEELRLRP